MTTKYISANVMKISVNSCKVQVKFLIFSTHEMKYVSYLLPKKYIFFFIFSDSENYRKSILIKIIFFPSHFSLILLDSTCLMGIIVGAFVPNIKMVYNVI